MEPLFRRKEGSRADEIREQEILRGLKAPAFKATPAMRRGHANFPCVLRVLCGQVYFGAGAILSDLGCLAMIMSFTLS